MPKEKTAKEAANTEKVSVGEFRAKVIGLAEKGMTSEKIGETLRHQGIHPKEYEKISNILKEKNLYVSGEVKSVQEKLSRITAHKEKHIQDKRALRERERIFSLLRKMKEYHNIT